jgi:hypothetical protein
MEIDQIKNSILEIRGIKVILDFELAKLYEVETRVLKQAVHRNIERFLAFAKLQRSKAEDFMFQLTEIEMQHLVSQNVIPTLNHFGGAKPFAFTEQGIAMLSSVLKSKKAIHMNISIMRAFVMMRQWAITLIADFDTHASAYYSACFNSWWTECPEGVYRRPTIKN